MALQHSYCFAFGLILDCGIFNQSELSQRMNTGSDEVDAGPGGSEPWGACKVILTENQLDTLSLEGALGG